MRKAEAKASGNEDILPIPFPQLKFFVVAANGKTIGEIDMKPVAPNDNHHIIEALDVDRMAEAMNHMSPDELQAMKRRLVDIIGRVEDYLRTPSDERRNGTTEKPSPPVALPEDLAEEVEEPPKPVKPVEPLIPPKPAKPATRARRSASRSRTRETAARNSHEETIKTEIAQQAIEQPSTPPVSTPTTPAPAEPETYSLQDVDLTGLNDLEKAIVAQLTGEMTFGEIQTALRKPSGEVFAAVKHLIEMERIERGTGTATYRRKA